MQTNRFWNTPPQGTLNVKRLKSQMSMGEREVKSAASVILTVVVILIGDTLGGFYYCVWFILFYYYICLSCLCYMCALACLQFCYYECFFKLLICIHASVVLTVIYFCAVYVGHKLTRTCVVFVVYTYRLWN